MVCVCSGEYAVFVRQLQCIFHMYGMWTALKYEISNESNGRITHNIHLQSAMHLRQRHWGCSMLYYTLMQSECTTCGLPKMIENNKTKYTPKREREKNLCILHVIFMDSIFLCIGFFCFWRMFGNSWTTQACLRANKTFESVKWIFHGQ